MDWNKPTVRRALIALVILGVAAAGVVVAAEIYGTSSGTVHHAAPNGPQITTEDVDYNESVPIQDGLIDFGHTRFTSTDVTHANASNFDSEYIVLEDVDATNAELAVDSRRPIVGISGQADRIEWRDYTPDEGLTTLSVQNPSSLSVRLTELPTDEWVVLRGPDDIYKWTGGNAQATFSIQSTGDYELETYSADIFSNPSPTDGVTVDQDPVTLSVDVDGPGTGSFTVEFRNATDGSLIGTDTITDNGTATTDWSQSQMLMGTNRWYATLQSGGSQSETNEFGIPGTLEIRDEQTQALLDGTNMTVDVSFYSGNETIYSRNTSDGRVDLSGLPTDRSFIVNVVDVNDSYHDRRIFISDITETATAYLLNTSANAVDIEFLLADKTGQFDGRDTRLLISKGFPVNQSGNTTIREFKQLSGDRFGAANGYSVTLEQGQRYQLRIANDERARLLGHYQPERSEAVELEIGELEWNLPRQIEGGIDWDAERVEENNRDMIRLQVNDSLNQLENVSVQIYETGNKSNMLLNDTLDGPFGELVVSQTVPQSQQDVASWTVDWEGDYNSTVGAQTILGAGSYGIGLPADRGLIAIFAGLLVTFVAGFFSVRVSELGLVIVPIVALGLFAIGWLPLPLTWILGALAIGVMTEFATRGGFDRR